MVRPAVRKTPCCPAQPNSMVRLGLYGIVLATILSSGCAQDNTVVDRQSILMAEETAGMEIGYAEAAAHKQTTVAVLAPEIQDSLQHLVDELVEVADCEIPCRIHMTNSPLMYAFALPCGDIFISSGMLDEVDNRDQIAVLLAHEIAHVRHKDGLAQLRYSFSQQQSARVTAALLSGVVGGAVSAAIGGQMRLVLTDTGPIYGLFYEKLVIGPSADVAARLAGRIPQAAVVHLIRLSIGQYTREHELRADRCSLEYTRKAGYDSQAGIELMKKLRQVRDRYQQQMKEKY